MTFTTDEYNALVAEQQSRIALPLEELLVRIRDRARPDSYDHLQALERRAALGPPHPLALSDEEREQALDLIVPIAANAQDEFRPTAVFTLGHLGLSSSAVQSTLARAIDDPEPHVRDCALRALEGLPDERSHLRGRLVGALRDPAVNVRSTALFVVGRCLSPSNRELAAVLLALDDPADSVSSAAAAAIDRWLQAGMVPADLVASQLAQKAPSVGSFELLRKLDRLDDATLFAALKASHTRVQAMGVLESRGVEALARGLRALEDLGPTELDDLIECFRLDTPDEVLDTTWLSTLLELAQSGSESLRLVAIAALGRFNRWPAVVGDELETLASTQPEPFASAARAALEALRARPSRPSNPGTRTRYATR